MILGSIYFGGGSEGGITFWEKKKKKDELFLLKCLLGLNSLAFP